MLIQCTKKLLDKLNIKLQEYVEEDLLFSWHANLITVNRRKIVVLVNDKNRYVIVLYGLKAKDFKSLDNVILQAIQNTFREECIREEITEQFITQANEVIYTKTKDRSSISRVNKACELVPRFEEFIQEESIYQSEISKRLSRFLVSIGAKDYISPNEELYKDLENFAEGPVLSCQAAQLKVTLDLEKHKVWRRIIVPANISFSNLHEVLQEVFGWKDYHLHEFYVYGNEKVFDNDQYINHSGYHKGGYKPCINLVSNEEAGAYPNDVPMKLEAGIKLCEYIPSKIKYNYDFGDNWQHYIEIERVIDDYDKNYSICLEGEGNTPPEDVGGESGYEEFLELTADENHPEHQQTVTWGRSQGFKEFDIEMVNKMLKIRY